ncbi:PIN-like domain-containing protein [Enterobacter roggenkampii]|uniref:PIN-like domain-containing protein n=1 Tax=Enterobacter roggenkampii TaxID=1812935 RepID=UPI001113255C|nr:PIN-like domain-containing protein [Enterobacter roggenkampii]
MLKNQASSMITGIYRCEEETKDDILNVMKTLSKRSWFPFHVCLEYQRNRIKVISQSIKSLETLKKSISSLVNSTDNALSEAQVKKHLYTSLSEEISLLKESLSTSIDTFIREKIEPRIKTKEKIKNSDSIRKVLDVIIGDNCGDMPDQEKINSINEEGIKRYATKIPPGFMDEKEKGENTSHYNGIEFKDKFGDLYLWKEIIDIAKQHENYNIIFVTDDSKKDWWFTYDNKTIGPSEPLQTEIYFNSNIAGFRMISHSSFLYEAGKYLDNLKIKESSVEDIKEISSNKNDTLIEEHFNKFLKNYFEISPSHIAKVREGKKVKRIRSQYIPFLSNKNDMENIVAAYEHFCHKYEELKKQYIETNELVDFKYDLLAEDEDTYKSHKLALQEINMRLTDLSGALSFIELEINESETSQIQETLDILLSNISAQVIKIQSMIFDLNRVLNK